MGKWLPDLGTDYTGDYPEDQPDHSRDCSSCDGTGYQGADDNRQICPTCLGSGRRPER